MRHTSLVLANPGHPNPHPPESRPPPLGGFTFEDGAHRLRRRRGCCIPARLADGMHPHRSRRVGPVPTLVLRFASFIPAPTPLPGRFAIARLLSGSLARRVFPRRGSGQTPLLLKRSNPRPVPGPGSRRHPWLAAPGTRPWLSASGRPVSSLASLGVADLPIQWPPCNDEHGCPPLWAMAEIVFTLALVLNPQTVTGSLAMANPTWLLCFSPARETLPAAGRNALSAGFSPRELDRRRDPDVASPQCLNTPPLPAFCRFRMPTYNACVQPLGINRRRDQHAIQYTLTQTPENRLHHTSVSPVLHVNA
jgi:hypothetical protein